MGEYIVFNTPDGEVSNDPYWQAEQTLAGRDKSDADDDLGDDYDDLNGKELKALAAEREVDISGLKKVGEVREALRADDAAKAAAAAENAGA